MALQEKYINPFTDFGFKKLFGTELNKDLLIDFLNEVILPQDKKIVDLKYRSNEHMGQTELDRKAIFDLYCMSSNRERFIVEMQKAKQNYFKDRSVFYSTFPIQEQAQTGDWNYKLLFEAAEIAKFSPEEKELYEDSLKSYRDLKNVIDTAYDEGELKGELKGKLEAQKEMVLKGIARGLDNSIIADLSGLTEIEVEELRK